MLNSQSVSASFLEGGAEKLGKAFWQQWEQYRDYLYRCCIKWMGGKPTDAEDALSRAMLKAWEKAQKYAGEIANFKSWLTTLTHNLCVDIHRERDRGANRVENIEVYAAHEEQGLVTFDDTPESAMETGEKRIVIRRAIDNLPSRLRETFILHFYHELSYPEIAQQQEISYQNVCKRISQARAILLKKLRGYFIGEDGTDTDKSVYGETRSEDGWYKAEAGIGKVKTDGKDPTAAFQSEEQLKRDAGLLKGSNVSAEAGFGDEQVGAFANAELFRLSAANNWGQADLAVNVKTGVKFGSHNEIKVLGTGLEIGKDGIGVSILGIGGKLKFW